MGVPFAVLAWLPLALRFSVLRPSLFLFSLALCLGKRGFAPKWLGKRRKRQNGPKSLERGGQREVTSRETPTCVGVILIGKTL